MAEPALRTRSIQVQHQIARKLNPVLLEQYDDGAAPGPKQALWRTSLQKKAAVDALWIVITRLAIALDNVADHERGYFNHSDKPDARTVGHIRVDDSDGPAVFRIRSNGLHNGTWITRMKDSGKLVVISDNAGDRCVRVVILVRGEARDGKVTGTEGVAPAVVEAKQLSIIEKLVLDEQ